MLRASITQLEAVMNCEGFFINRTGGTQGHTFLNFGDIASIYYNIENFRTDRHSTIPYNLRSGIKGRPRGLTLVKIATLCSSSLFQKAAKHEVSLSSIISTQSFTLRNTINRQVRSTKIHEQGITRAPEKRNSIFVDQTAFTMKIGQQLACLITLYLKEAVTNGKPCSDILKQLRRTILLVYTTI